jgi:hypothetical protein
MAVAVPEPVFPNSWRDMIARGRETDALDARWPPIMAGAPPSVMPGLDLG